MPEENRFSAQRILAVSVLVLTLINVVIGAMFLRQAQLVHNARGWILHSHEVSESVEVLSNKIKDAALYQRNYLISGDSIFLDDYNALVKSAENTESVPDALSVSGWISDDIVRLRNLIADNPVQIRNTENLAEETGELQSYLNAMISLQQQQKTKLAGSEQNIRHGAAIMSRIRTTVSGMLNEEKRLLEERTGAYEVNSARNTEFVLGAIIFFYLIKLSLIVFATRQWRETQKLEQQHHMRALEVSAANEKLERANQELETLNRQIAESGQARLSAVVNNALDGLITINTRGTIESFNPACERIFEYTADEVIGQNIKILMPEPYFSEHDGYLQHYHDTGKAAILGTAGREVSAKRKNGSVFPMDLSISAFFLNGEQHFSGILRDITLRKQAEAELLRYTKELEHSNQELDDFAYIASHDMKEPLRGLFNHASFLLEDYKEKLDEEGVRRLHRLSQLAQRMEQLVNDLLYFSRLGRSDLAIQFTDPNQIISEIGQMMESFLKERNARILVPTPMPVMVCDKPRITEVFRNLITNAIKYNDKPEPLVEIGFLSSANAPHGPEKNVFYVKDNGIGIEPEFHQEIFRIFKRLNPEQSSERGSGVGLTFVKKIIERHKGHIWLESEPGQGTTFYFNLTQEGERHG